MKKGRPTVRNVRQGQTVYTTFVSLGKDPLGNEREVKAWRLYSHREPLPEPGIIIERLPVSHLRKYLQRYGSDGIFFSRGKAERAVREGIW